MSKWQLPLSLRVGEPRGIAGIGTVFQSSSPLPGDSQSAASANSCLREGGPVLLYLKTIFLKAISFKEKPESIF